MVELRDKLGEVAGDGRWVPDNEFRREQRTREAAVMLFIAGRGLTRREMLEIYSRCYPHGEYAEFSLKGFDEALRLAVDHNVFLKSPHRRNATYQLNPEIEMDTRDYERDYICDGIEALFREKD
jgi:hypothetical protein